MVDRLAHHVFAILMLCYMAPAYFSVMGWAHEIRLYILNNVLHHTFKHFRITWHAFYLYGDLMLACGVFILIFWLIFRQLNSGRNHKLIPFLTALIIFHLLCCVALLVINVSPTLLKAQPLGEISIAHLFRPSFVFIKIHSIIEGLLLINAFVSVYYGLLIAHYLYDKDYKWYHTLLEAGVVATIVGAFLLGYYLFLMRLVIGL